MHFLSDLGKIKPRNEEKRCILGLQRLTLGVWGHCGAQNMDFSSLKGAGQVTVTKEVWTYFTRQKPILVPDGPRPQRKTFLDIFWRVFESFLGFILPQTDQKCTFYTIFSSKLPSGRYEASSNWIFAPRSILSPRMSSDPKERRSGHKMHLISSFLGFILPKSDQKCTF